MIDKFFVFNSRHLRLRVGSELESDIDVTSDNKALTSHAVLCVTCCRTGKVR